MKKVCVIGHFGLGKNLLNGQTIKTKNVASELEKHVGVENLTRIDTHGGFIALLKLPFMLLYANFFFQNVVIMPAQNGLRIIAPLLVCFNLLFRKKLHYVVVGGWLPEFLKKRHFLSRCLKKIQAIYVETETMKADLLQLSFHNVQVMHNFKDLKILEESEIPQFFSEHYCVCTFSRVMKEKGIEFAISAVKRVNEHAGQDVCFLDIFGQIDELQKDWFERLKKTFPPYVHYKGCVPFENSVETLKNYYLLLFPTYYRGEGFAGTLLDSFAAGVPVIASDWHFNKDIVDDEQNGFIVNVKDVSSLVEKIEWCIINKPFLKEMRKKCVRKAKKFLPDQAVQPLIRALV